MKSHGIAHHSATLTPEDVREMRRLRFEELLPYHRIARAYGVSKQAAWDAINSFTWKHVK